MRKLTKKISMLMVLAMLVGLFSGVVSASAASQWSFKSGKYDVAVGGEINMQKDEFADFDLLKEGKAPEGYTVAWASDNENAVWVNATSGKLRADKFGKAEDGDKAVISATFTNETTGKSATRSFTIVVGEVAAPVAPDFKVTCADVTVKVGEAAKFAPEVTLDGEVVKFPVHKSYNVYFLDGKVIGNDWVADKAGEYTVTLAQFGSKADRDEADLAKALRTVDFKVVVELNAATMTAEQTALNAVELTFNDAAWAAKANKETIVAAQVIDGVDINELVKDVTVKDAVATVTLFNNLAAGKTYKFAFGEDCVADVVGANSDPYSIKVVSKQVPANTLGQAEIKVFNSAGIDVTTDALKYAAEFSTEENTFCDVQADGSIYFFEVGKTVVVKAKFDMGWDSEGNELKDLEAVGEYTSVEPIVYSKPNGYALSNQLEEKNKDLTYTTSTLKISLSDENFRLIAKYDADPFDGDVVAKYIDTGSDDHGNVAAYTYKSTNESILLVNETTGEFLPCDDGYASVYIKKGDTVVGSVSVKVEAARKLNTFTASIADKKLATALTPADSTQIVVSAADQFGAAYGKVKYSMVLDTLQVNGADVVLTDFFNIADATNLVEVDGKITLTLAATAAAKIADNKVQSIAFTIKATDTDPANANNEKTQRLSVSIKDNTGYKGSVNRRLEVSTGKVDTALNKKNFSDYNVTIKLVKTDADTYDLGLETIAFEKAATTANAYSVVVTKVGDNNFDATTCGFFAITGNVLTVSAVKDATTKLGNGTYKIQLYTRNQSGDKMQPSTPQYLTIEDNTPAVTAVVKTTNIDYVANIKSALEFYINGAKVDSNNVDNVVAIEPIAVNSKVYVKKVRVTLKTKALNGDSALNTTFDKEVEVNQLFTEGL